MIFGIEVDGGKAWRGRLPGALEGAREHGVEGRSLRGISTDCEGCIAQLKLARACDSGMKHDEVLRQLVSETP